MTAWGWLAIAVGAMSCTGGAPPVVITESPVPDGATTRVPTVAYTWDPAIGDAAVPADKGGPGFDGSGWQTHLERLQIAVPTAPQGGRFATDMPDWPVTLRQAGVNWNTYFNFLVGPLLYQSLLDLDPVTLELVPSLATHWWISQDQRTFRFRINPAARWSDGREVTAQDVVETFRLRADPAMQDPLSARTFGHMEPPVAVSKYVVEVRSRDDSWQNFLYFATMGILPAAELTGLKAADYLDRYQFGYTAVTGPYHVLPADIQMGTAITLTRRADWWGEGNAVWDGWYNFERLQFVVVKDPTLKFEKLKRGEIDFMVVPRAQWWNEDIPALQAVKHGLLVPRKFYTDAPRGLSGIVMNGQKAPLDDVRVRRALQKLFDFDRMNDKLFFREYEPLASYFPGPYANPENARVEFDPEGAAGLLEEAGWTERNVDGYRVREGKELTLTLSYASPIVDKALEMYQEACKEAGVKIDLEPLDDSALWRSLQQKEFLLAWQSWGATMFPNPEDMWRSRLAFEKDNNNVAGYVNGRSDYLCDKYDREYDPAKRVAILREIDGMVAAEAPYVLGWANPAQRVLFWNRFGMPPWGTARTGVWSAATNLWVLWWEDADRVAQIEAAKTDGSIAVPQGARENRFWKQWDAAHPTP